MSVKPILFNTDMVQAILDGRKTVTRRIIKPQPETVYVNSEQRDIANRNQIAFKIMDNGGKDCYTFPPYQPGDILYVRETWQKTYINDGTTHPTNFKYEYKASDEQRTVYRWLPSIHMPKEAARIWLKVTNVRVERLQDITEEQAKAEGISEEWAMAWWKPTYNDPDSGGYPEYRKTFAWDLWDSTVKKADVDQYGWKSNPWVWVIEFERCEKPREDNK